ncbi:MAG TPA: BON domain-containing protein [Gammaproteobacteria bacterium]|nr:BON domain-containing protein [Gammaproteobacteria bacterium]
MRKLILVVPILAMLGGCVLAFDGGDSSHGHWSNYSSDSDRALAVAVRNNLDDDSQTRAAAIRVYSDDGDITLRGRVKDASTLARAVSLALATPGVDKVVCEIVVDKD